MELIERILTKHQSSLHMLLVGGFLKVYIIIYDLINHNIPWNPLPPPPPTPSEKEQPPMIILLY